MLDIVASKCDETTTHAGKWTKEEDTKLKDAVEKRNGKDWSDNSKLVPGRTKQQCLSRWHDNVSSKSDETTARVGKWTTDEDSTLEHAVDMHNAKNWAAISALVHGRTKQQCSSRWHNMLNSMSDETTARKGKWIKEEDVKLKDAVEKYNTDWTAISKLVPDRTIQQCRYRWAYRSNPSRITTTEEEG
jgi:hypothetical protein